MFYPPIKRISAFLFTTLKLWFFLAYGFGPSTFNSIGTHDWNLISNALSLPIQFKNVISLCIYPSLLTPPKQNTPSYFRSIFKFGSISFVLTNLWCERLCLWTSEYSLFYVEMIIEFWIKFALKFMKCISFEFVYFSSIPPWINRVLPNKVEAWDLIAKHDRSLLHSFFSKL